MEDGYAICLNEWALDNSIKGELGLLLIISSLTAKEGFCYASNEYFAKLFKTTEQTISKKIKKLEQKNYITISYKKRGCEVISRKIRLTKMLIDDYRKRESTINENVKENNISINNTSINNIYIVEQVIKHLNEITNSNYKSTTRTTREKIIARLNEGFTLDDFIVVIDKKYWDWKDTKFEQYMRPETLFGTKFESYLNQPVKKKTTKDIKLDDKFYEELMKA
jgi:uncharacterized phage protein (TIGR02220 family)